MALLGEEPAQAQGFARGTALELDVSREQAGTEGERSLGPLGRRGRHNQQPDEERGQE